jgi:hypothetical protein
MAINTRDKVHIFIFLATQLKNQIYEFDNFNFFFFFWGFSSGAKNPQKSLLFHFFDF